MLKEEKKNFYTGFYSMIVKHRKGVFRTVSIIYDRTFSSKKLHHRCSEGILMRVYIIQMQENILDLVLINMFRLRINEIMWIKTPIPSGRSNRRSTRSCSSIVTTDCSFAIWKGYHTPLPT